MPKYSDFAGAIFDVDDTLIDNYPKGHKYGLHEESRFLAIMQIAKRRNIPELLSLTEQQNNEAFQTAPVHSLEGAVWNVLIIAGLQNDPAINHQDPLFREIVEQKNIMHEDFIKKHAQEVTGASDFVRSLYDNGLEGRLGIASTALRRDVIMALDIMRIRHLFADQNIFTKERFKNPKPHPESFQKAYESLGLRLPPSRVLALEDHPRGIASAKAAGLFTCGIASPFFTKEQLESLNVPPDVAVSSYAELREVLGL